MKSVGTTDQGNRNKEACLTKGPIDTKSALERAMGDLEFLEMMLQQFLEQMPGHLEEIKAALEKGDKETVCQKAHALKGSAANLSALDVASAAFHLEKIGHTGELKKGEETLDLLQNEISRLGDYISRPNWNRLPRNK